MGAKLVSQRKTRKTAAQKATKTQRAVVNERNAIYREY